jgi:hypothetical protein
MAYPIANANLQPEFLTLTSTRTAFDEDAPSLRGELLLWRSAFQEQTTAVQDLFHAQAVSISGALLADRDRVAFTLPARVVYRIGQDAGPVELEIPSEYAAQTIALFPGRLGTKDIRGKFRRRLSQLEQSTYHGVAYAAGLLRFVTASYLIERLEQNHRSAAGGSVEPAVFPEWIAFEQHRLVVPTEADAEARIAGMQRYLAALSLAISLAPYFYTDDAFQAKRNGALVQLINQSRSMAAYQVGQIIEKIQHWSAEHRLDRGLRLSVPYFDDAALDLKLRTVDVIPVGRTRFVPAFLVLAMQRERVRVEEDPSLAIATRVHLLELLATIEQAFLPGQTETDRTEGKI